MTVDAIEHEQSAREALKDLVEIIEAARLHNLARGVELGQTAWFVKASDRLAYAKQVLSGQISELEAAGCGGIK